LKDKIVIITGASSGIGKALAEKFAREGSSVVLAARNMEKLQGLEQSLKAAGVEVLSVVTDVSEREDCRKLIDATVDRFGRIDILINNAGISMRALFEEVELEVIDQLMAVNFFGTVNCTRFAIPHLLTSKGSVVGVSSIAGHRGLPGRTGYSASKFAMHGFLEALRTEVMSRGVHVLLACPGFTASNIRKVALVADGSTQKETPLEEEKMMSAETVADHIYEAIRHRRRDLTLTTQGRLTVFLNKWFPGFMDRMVLNHFRKEADSPVR
jgi:short-subunit dehydrogenase